MTGAGYLGSHPQYKLQTFPGTLLAGLLAGAPAAVALGRQPVRVQGE